MVGPAHKIERCRIRREFDTYGNTEVLLHNGSIFYSDECIVFEIVEGQQKQVAKQ